MKHLRKVITLMLAAFMALAVSVPAFAATQHSITIENTNSSISIEGKKYNAYKLFDSTHSGTAYSYTMSTSNQFYSGDLVADAEPADGTLAKVLRTYFTFTAVPGDSTKVNVTPKRDLTSSDARDLADAIQPFLKDMTANSTGTGGSDQKAVITLPDDEAGQGYYIVTGEIKSSNAESTETVESAVILTNEDPSPTIQPKASIPSVEKTIEDIAANAAKVRAEGKTANGSVGDIVTYNLDSTVPDMTGYVNYIFKYTDTMSKGLTFNDDVTIKVGNKDLVKDTDFTVTTAAGQNDTTVVTINLENFVQYKDNQGDAIHVEYSATVNQDALIIEENDAKLTYSSSPYPSEGGEPGDVTGETPGSKTWVYLTNIKLKKVDGTGETLEGAKFSFTGNSSKVYILNEEIYVEDANGEWYRLKDGTYTKTAPTAATEDKYDGDKKYTLTETITKDNVTVNYTNEAWVKSDGTLDFQGIGEGTYTITELVAPDGFNLLTSPITVKVTFTCDENGENGAFSATVDGEAVTWDPETNTIEFDIENQSGTELPSTGGMGTRILYTVGGIMLVGGAIALVSKKRAASLEK